MKRIMGILAASAFCLGLGASAASATTINFNDVVGGSVALPTDVSTHYSALGVTFTDSFARTGVVAPSGTFLLSNNFEAGQGGTTQTSDSQDLRIDFSVPVTSVSATIYRSPGFFFSYEAFGSSGLLGSGTSATDTLPLGEDPFAFSFSDPTDITFLLLTTHPTSNPSSFGGFRMDDLTFTGPTVVGGVPEPSTWAMLLIGFAGMAYVARRRGRSTRFLFRSAGEAA